jgi:hypothetical protein
LLTVIVEAYIQRCIDDSDVLLWYFRSALGTGSIGIITVFKRALALKDNYLAMTYIGH